MYTCAICLTRVQEPSLMDQTFLVLGNKGCYLRCKSGCRTDEHRYPYRFGPLPRPESVCRVKPRIATLLIMIVIGWAIAFHVFDAWGNVKDVNVTRDKVNDIQFLITILAVICILRVLGWYTESSKKVP